MSFRDLVFPVVDFEKVVRDPYPVLPDVTATSPPRTIPLAVLSGRAFKARALLLAERIDLRARRADEVVAMNPLTVAVDGGGLAVLFRYGVVCLVSRKARRRHFSTPCSRCSATAARGRKPRRWRSASIRQATRACKGRRCTWRR